jgi:hypothetical protein
MRRGLARAQTIIFPSPPGGRDRGGSGRDRRRPLADWAVREPGRRSFRVIGRWSVNLNRRSPNGGGGHRGDTYVDSASTYPHTSAVPNCHLDPYFHPTTGTDCHLDPLSHAISNGAVVLFPGCRPSVGRCMGSRQAWLPHCAIRRHVGCVGTL